MELEAVIQTAFTQLEEEAKGIMEPDALRHLISQYAALPKSSLRYDKTGKDLVKYITQEVRQALNRAK